MQTEYVAFIAAAYGVSALALAGLGLWILLDGRSVRAELKALEARGLRRRSGRERGTMSEEAHPAAPPSGGPPAPALLLAALPVLLFAGSPAVFLYQLVSGHDPQEIPSALIGAKAPATNLPPLEGLAVADGRPVPGLDLAAAGDGRPVARQRLRLLVRALPAGASAL